MTWIRIGPLRENVADRVYSPEIGLKIYACLIMGLQATGWTMVTKNIGIGNSKLLKNTYFDVVAVFCS